jgi:hypothetical protein
MATLSWLGVSLAGCIALAACAAANEQAATSSSGDTTGPGGAGGAGGAGAAASGGSDAGGTGGGGAGGAGAGGEDCPGPAGATLAMDELFLGTTDFNGNPAVDAWMTYGFDIDGMNTTSNLNGHCQPFQGAPVGVVSDGAQGIDNGFGKNVLPILLPLVPEIQEQANTALETGQFSLLFHFSGLADEANKDPLKTMLYAGSPLGEAPKWDGSDCWPLLDSSLTDTNDIASAKITFAESVLAGNSWDSNGTATLVLPIRILGIEAPMTIYQARMSTVMSSTHQGAALGRIGGVLDTEEFIDMVRNVAAAVNPPFCGMAFDPTADSIRVASDIMKDGSQDPNSTCDGISIGIGFTLLHAKLGPIEKAPAPAPKPCD